MPTRSVKETFLQRAKRDPKFRTALIGEALELIAEDNVEAAKSLIRHYIEPSDVAMTHAVQQFVAAFEALPEAERHEAAVIILRRFAGAMASGVADEPHVECAEGLFQALDAEEAGHAPG